MNLVNSLERTQYKQFQDGYDFTINLIQLIENTKKIKNVKIDTIKKYFYDFNITNKKLYDTEQQWLEAFAENYRILLLENILNLLQDKVSHDIVKQLENLK